VLAPGEREHGIGSREQCPELRVGQIAGEADVGCWREAVGLPGEHDLDAGQLGRGREHGLDRFVGVPAARIDHPDRKPGPASVVGGHVGKRRWWVVEDDGRTARKAVGELGQGHQDGVGKPCGQHEPSPRPAGPRAENGGGVRVDDDPAAGEESPAECEQHQRQRRRHDHEPVGSAPDQEHGSPHELHRVAPQHGPAPAKTTVRDEHGLPAELPGETDAAPMVADPGQDQRARGPTHNRTTVEPDGAALRVSNTMSLTAATASRSIAPCAVSTTARSY
jgi:hypothetical protein